MLGSCIILRLLEPLAVVEPENRRLSKDPFEIGNGDLLRTAQGRQLAEASVEQAAEVLQFHSQDSVQCHPTRR